MRWISKNRAVDACIRIPNEPNAFLKSQEIGRKGFVARVLRALGGSFSLRLSFLLLAPHVCPPCPSPSTLTAATRSSVSLRRARARSLSLRSPWPHAPPVSFHLLRHGKTGFFPSPIRRAVLRTPVSVGRVGRIAGSASVRVSRSALPRRAHRARTADAPCCHTSSSTRRVAPSRFRALSLARSRSDFLPSAAARINRTPPLPPVPAVGIPTPPKRSPRRFVRLRLPARLARSLAWLSTSMPYAAILRARDAGENS